MPNVSLMTTRGVADGTVELSAGVFGLTPNVPLMHQVVTAQLARRRAGTQSTKTRAEVRGGGRKPFKQKGTGNARQGSTRAPHWAGGGVALGPKPRSYAQRTPKKMIAAALRSALSDRAASEKVIVLKTWGFDKPSTKAAAAAIKSMGISGRALVVVDGDDENTILSLRNLQNIQLVDRRELNAYDVLVNEYVIFTPDTLPTAEASTRSTRTTIERPIKAAAPKPSAAPAPAAAAEPEVVEWAPRTPVAEPIAEAQPLVDTASSDDAAMGEAKVTRRVTVRTIVDGVETVEVREETVDMVDASTVPDYSPDTTDTTVVRRERTIVDGQVTESSESISTEEDAS